MEARCGNLTAEGTTGDLLLGNERVRVRLFAQDGGFAQELYAVDKRGRFQLVLSSLTKSLILSSEHRTTASPMIAGQRPHLFSVNPDSLRMPYSRAEVTRYDEHAVTATLHGATGGHSLTCNITVEAGGNAIHVVIDDEIERNGSDPLVEYLMSSYAFLPGGRVLSVGETPDYVWAPMLRPADDHVIGDLAFHAPAVIVRLGPFAAALVPDLDILAADRVMPTCLDLDVRNGLLPAPLISYGFCGYQPVQRGTHCLHDITHARRLTEPRLRFGYHLILDAGREEMTSQRQAASFLWRSYASRYAEHASPSAGESDVLSNLGRLRPDARTAFGLHTRGTKDGDPRLVQAARRLKNELLLAPRDGGLFPTRFNSQSDEWTGCSQGVGDAYYSTAECSEQLLWLLRWHEVVEQDQALYRWCRKYGDFLIGSRLRDGAIPTWYTRERHPIYPISALQTAQSALFLAELARVTGFAKYAKAAERSAGYVLAEIVPACLYQDHTLADRTQRRTFECTDPHTHVRPQSSAAMLAAAELCLAMHKLNGDASYLDSGEEALSQLCLLQAVWKKPWEERENEFGLLARGNADCGYDAELTAEFARCAMGYARATGEPEFAERGAEAIEAALAEADLTVPSRLRIAASAALFEAEFPEEQDATAVSAAALRPATEVPVRARA